MIRRPFLPTTLLLLLFYTSNISVFAQNVSFFNPDSVDSATRNSWCFAQITSCRTICGPDISALSTNACDPSTLAYSCTCASSVPDLSLYVGTIPYFECESASETCNLNNPGDAAAQSRCPKCATQTPVDLYSGNPMESFALETTATPAPSSSTEATVASTASVSTASVAHSPYETGGGGGFSDGGLTGSQIEGMICGLVAFAFTVLVGGVWVFCCVSGRRRRRRRRRARARDADEAPVDAEPPGMDVDPPPPYEKVGGDRERAAVGDGSAHVVEIPPER